MHGAKREFFKNDFVQDLRMIWFLFKISPEKDRPAFLAKTHFLLLRRNPYFASASLETSGKKQYQDQEVLNTKKKRGRRGKRGTVSISVEKGRHKSFTETLSPASAGTSLVQTICRLPKEIVWRLRYRILRKTRSITKTSCVNTCKSQIRTFSSTAAGVVTEAKHSPVGTCCCWATQPACNQLCIPLHMAIPAGNRTAFLSFCFNPNWNSSRAPHKRCKQSLYHTDINAVTKQLTTETRRRTQGSSGTESGCNKTWSHTAEAVPEEMQRDF